jgi:hypothetical protein
VRRLLSSGRARGSQRCQVQSCLQTHPAVQAVWTLELRTLPSPQLVLRLESPVRQLPLRLAKPPCGKLGTYLSIFARRCRESYTCSQHKYNQHTDAEPFCPLRPESLSEASLSVFILLVTLLLAIEQIRAFLAAGPPIIQAWCCSLEICWRRIARIEGFVEQRRLRFSVLVYVSG